MTNIIKKDWYIRIDKVEALGAAHCPRCEAPYQVGPVFDHDPRPCLNCQVPLIEWNMMQPIFIIDLERAPALVKTITDHLSPLTEQEADMELLALLQFLGVIKY